MSGDPFKARGRAVPRGRLSRLGQFGRLAGGVAGEIVGIYQRHNWKDEKRDALEAWATPLPPCS